MLEIAILTSTATEGRTALHLSSFLHCHGPLHNETGKKNVFSCSSSRGQPRNRQRNYLQLVKQLPLVVIQSFDLFLQFPCWIHKRGTVFPCFTAFERLHLQLLSKFCKQNVFINTYRCTVQSYIFHQYILGTGNCVEQFIPPFLFLALLVPRRSKQMREKPHKTGCLSLHNCRCPNTKKHKLHNQIFIKKKMVHMMPGRSVKPEYKFHNNLFGYTLEGESLRLHLHEGFPSTALTLMRHVRMWNLCAFRLLLLLQHHSH